MNADNDTDARDDDEVPGAGDLCGTAVDDSAHSSRPVVAETDSLGNWWARQIATSVSALVIIVLLFCIALHGCGLSVSRGEEISSFDDEVERLIQRISENGESDKVIQFQAAAEVLDRYLVQREEMRFRRYVVTIGSLGIGLAAILGLYIVNRLLETDTVLRPGSHFGAVVAIPISIFLASTLLLMYASVKLVEGDASTAFKSLNEITPKFLNESGPPAPSD